MRVLPKETEVHESHARVVLEQIRQRALVRGDAREEAAQAVLEVEDLLLQLEGDVAPVHLVLELPQHHRLHLVEQLVLLVLRVQHSGEKRLIRMRLEGVSQVLLAGDEIVFTGRRMRTMH